MYFKKIFLLLFDPNIIYSVSHYKIRGLFVLIIRLKFKATLT